MGRVGYGDISPPIWRRGDRGLTMDDPLVMDRLFTALAGSPFRSRFRLSAKERDYLEQKGMAVILQHAREFIQARLAPAHPSHDGKQTPMRNHPAFVAQHATATCCRKCLTKWHGIPCGRPLDEAEIDYVVSVIGHWLRRQRPPCFENIP
jgi:hypothetical protein